LLRRNRINPSSPANVRVCSRTRAAVLAHEL